MEKTVELTDDPTALALLAQGCARIGQSDKARNVLSQLNTEALKLNVESWALSVESCTKNDAACTNFDQGRAAKRCTDRFGSRPGMGAYAARFERLFVYRAE